jgi:hypothetical protein
MVMQGHPVEKHLLQVARTNGHEISLVKTLGLQHYGVICVLCGHELVDWHEYGRGFNYALTDIRYDDFLYSPCLAGAIAADDLHAIY